MLLREDDRGVLAIGQPSHAWISGQLARAWGNERFGAVEPLEEVCLAAGQHDIGWTGWEVEPTLNPETGRPHSFMEMPLAVHLELWVDAPRRLLSQSRYAALLTSIHGARLYKRRDLDSSPPAEADAIRGFLAQQDELQRELIGSLRADPGTAPAVAPEVLARNSQLIWIWDYLSLALCLGWTAATARDVPSASEAVDVELVPGPRPGNLSLEPWPLAAPVLTVRCEGRRLNDRFDDEESMRRAIRRAPWETLEIELAGR